MKPQKPNIKLLSTDFSDLRHKTIYDFIGQDGVLALRKYYLSLCDAGDSEAKLMSYVGGRASDVIMPGEEDTFVPFNNRRDLMTLAHFLHNCDLWLAAKSQLSD